MSGGLERIPKRLRSAVGEVFAFECKVRELWPTEAGPSAELRTKVEARTLPAAQLVLMRFALDFYDGSGGGISLAECVEALLEQDDRASMEAFFFLGEFLGSALTDMPQSLEAWAGDWLDNIAAGETH